VRRYDSGDRGGVVVLARAATRAALLRLLGDREALGVAIRRDRARVARARRQRLADDIDRELRPAASSTELRPRRPRQLQRSSRAGRRSAGSRCSSNAR